MQKVLDQITGWMKQLTDLFVSLIMIGVVVGILFEDTFGVIDGIGRLMSKFGDNGLAGLLALILIVVWYQKK